MIQPRAMLCQFYLTVALICILFGTILPPSSVYALPMQANSLHVIGQHSQATYHCRDYHEVRAGQNLYRISIHYNVNIHILAQANGISDINRVSAGEILCIPDLGTPNKPPTVTPIPIHTPTHVHIHTHTPPTATPIPSDTPTHEHIHTHTPPTATPIPVDTPIPTDTPTHVHVHTHTPPTNTPITPTETSTATIGSTTTPTVVSTPQPGVWHGEYFDNMTLNGVPSSVRDDPEINFDWGSNAPDIIPNTADHFSVRWTRTEYFEEGLYHFHAVVDDGIIVRIDREIILESWYENPIHYLDVLLDGGDHIIQVEYYERTGDARVYLTWTKL